MEVLFAGFAVLMAMSPIILIAAVLCMFAYRRKNERYEDEPRWRPL